MNWLKLVINLSARTDRRRQMERQLRRVGWHAEFFAAIRPEDKGEFPTVGTRGCFLSHLACLEIALQRQADILVLMEDDLDFSRDMRQRWNAVDKFLKSELFDFMYLGHNFSYRDSGILRIRHDEVSVGAHFLILRRQVIELVSAELRSMLVRPEGHPLGGPMHVDGAYSTIRMQHPALITYAHFPPLGYQRSSATDVHSPRLLDRYSLFAPIVKVGRNLKNILR